jgi:DNA-binding transcriptional LysR family regulator
MNSQLDWSDVRYFLAVATHRTLTAAGVALGVDHSTVLRRVQGLEKELGARLFDRSQRGYAPTQLGEDLVPIARRIEDEMLTLSRHAAGADKTLHGRLAVTTVSDWGDIICRHLRGFYEKYPGIELGVHLGERVLRLGDREVDVAIRPSMSDPSEPDVIARSVCGIGTALYASCEYLELHGRPRRRSELARHKLITGDRLLERLSKRHLADVPDENIIYRCNNMSNLFSAIRHGFGIGVSTCWQGDSDRSVVRLFKPIVVGDLWIMYHRDLRRNARVRAFVDHMYDALSSEADLVEGRRPQSTRHAR